MACNYPVIRIPEEKFSSKVLPAELRYVKAINSGVFYSFSKKDLLLKYFSEYDMQLIPCGQCIDCRLSYSRHWAERCMLEASLHEFNYFVTLTYDDFHIPMGNYLDHDGEVKTSSLNRRDFQLFMKKLRNNAYEKFDHTGVRCFYCGEYGDLHDRPHYHAILFNMPDLSSEFTFFNKRGSFSSYTSDLISSSWSDPYSNLSKGIATISDISYDTCAYVARYVVKKQKGLSSDYFNSLDISDISKRVQPFVGMSNRPGIARAYYDSHKEDIYTTDSVLYKKDHDVYSAKPPRYFDKLYDIEYPDNMEVIKNSRLVSSTAMQHAKLTQFSEPVLDRLDRQEEISSRREEKRFSVL